MRSDLLLTLLEVAEGSENFKPSNLDILEAWGLITTGVEMDLTDRGRRFVAQQQDLPTPGKEETDV